MGYCSVRFKTNNTLCGAFALFCGHLKCSTALCGIQASVLHCNGTVFRLSYCIQAVALHCICTVFRMLHCICSAQDAVLHCISTVFGPLCCRAFTQCSGCHVALYLHCVQTVVLHYICIQTVFRLLRCAASLTATFQHKGKHSEKAF